MISKQDVCIGTGIGGAGGAGSPVDATDGSCLVHDFLYAMYGYTAGQNFGTYQGGLQEMNQALCNVAENNESHSGMVVKQYFKNVVAGVNAWTGFSLTGGSACN